MIAKLCLVFALAIVSLSSAQADLAKYGIQTDRVDMQQLCFLDYILEDTIKKYKYEFFVRKLENDRFSLLKVSFGAANDGPAARFTNTNACEVDEKCKKIGKTGWFASKISFKVKRPKEESDAQIAERAHEEIMKRLSHLPEFYRCWENSAVRKKKAEGV